MIRKYMIEDTQSTTKLAICHQHGLVCCRITSQRHPDFTWLSRVNDYHRNFYNGTHVHFSFAVPCCISGKVIQSHRDSVRLGSWLMKSGEATYQNIWKSSCMKWPDKRRPRPPEFKAETLIYPLWNHGFKSKKKKTNKVEMSVFKIVAILIKIK